MAEVTANISECRTCFCDTDPAVAAKELVESMKLSIRRLIGRRVYLNRLGKLFGSKGFGKQQI